MGCMGRKKTPDAEDSGQIIGPKIAPGNPQPQSGSVPSGHSQAKRYPTDSSYHDFHGNPSNRNDPNAPTWMRASEARNQQAGLNPNKMYRPRPNPQGRPGRRGPPPKLPYPNIFQNGEALPLSTPGSLLRPQKPQEHLHNPLIPGQNHTWTNGSGPPGAIRGVYTQGDAKQFDVVYHDPNAPYSRNRRDRGFSKATYVPKAT